MTTKAETWDAENYFDDEYYENQPCESCPKCGRTYDHLGFDLQYCKVCGWDEEHKKFDKSIEPTQADYEEGEADILTGRWY